MTRTRLMSAGWATSAIVSGVAFATLDQMAWRIVGVMSALIAAFLAGFYVTRSSM